MAIVKTSVAVMGALWLAVAGCASGGDTGDDGGDETAAEQAAAKVTAYTMIRHWNQAAIDASGLDNTPLAPGENRVYGQQLGPTRSSRALAITQLAVFEAVNAISGQYKSYVGMKPATDASMTVAIAQAAHDALSAMYPSQKPAFDAQLKKDLAALPSKSKSGGIKLGELAAAKVLALRAHDNSSTPEPKVGVDVPEATGPGQWTPDPIGGNQTALGYYWAKVTPFTLSSADEFRAPPPPALDSPEYLAAYNEVNTLGGDGVATTTTRTATESQIGVFWAYDGSPSLCAPPRLYNEVAMTIAIQQGTATDPVELSRLLALVNVAMADTAIAIWDSKYYYNFWRPVTAIRATSGDLGNPTWSPLGAPLANQTGLNFTPPFPSYPSGHGGFGGALFGILRAYYGTDNIPFDFVSDEFNGITTDNQGNVRPVVQRHYNTLSQAEEENGESRIYLGIHWNFDKTESVTLGNLVADHVYDNFFTPAN